MLRQLCLSVLIAASVTGCAAPSHYPASEMGETDIRWGHITRIDPVEVRSSEQLGAGAIFGGIAGGLLGHQVGKGHGRTAATVAGALLGGYAGNQVQSASSVQQGQHIFVHLQGGVTVGVTQPVDPSLRVGDLVRIDGSGPTARVVRR